MSRSAVALGPLKLPFEVGANMSIVTVVSLSNAIGSSGEDESKPAPLASVAWATSASLPPVPPPPSLSPPDSAVFHVRVTSGARAGSGSNGIAASASFSDSTESSFITTLESETLINLDDENSIAPPDIVRLHKMILSVIEYFFFTGATWAFETLVRAAFPSLAICGQLDPVHSSWPEFAQAFFDFLSA